MGQGRLTTITNFENINLETDIQEGVAGGVCYSDSAGVNLQVCFTLHLCWNFICNVGMHVDINLSSSPFFFLSNLVVQHLVECLSSFQKGKWHRLVGRTAIDEQIQGLTRLLKD